MTIHIRNRLALLGGGLMMLNVAIAVLSASSCDIVQSRAKDGGQTLTSQPNKRVESAAATWQQSDELKCPVTLAASALSATDQCFLGGPTPAPPTTVDAIRIPVYFHILMSSSGEGDVCDQALQAQINILNEAYAGRTGSNAAPTAFVFFLAGIERKVNDTWFTMTYGEQPTDVEREAKQANQGNKSALHVYTAKIYIYGWTRWPWDLADQADGVVLNYATVPGVGKPEHSLGDVLVHEVGHWLGLFHIYERGCNAPGDCVEDTDAAAGKQTFCQTGLDTCPNQGAADPLENFMADTPDSCVYRFTPGQAARMLAIYRKYRS